MFVWNNLNYNNPRMDAITKNYGNVNIEVLKISETREKKATVICLQGWR